MKLTELNSLVDNYIDKLITESAYQDFFKGMLKKYGVKSPTQLPPDKKKKFFDEIKKEWPKAKKKAK